MQVVHIYFDTSTFDQVEKDVKVVKTSKCVSNVSMSGDPGGSIGFDWGHDGTLHWLLHSQWHRDRLLCCQVLSQEDEEL